MSETTAFPGQTPVAPLAPVRPRLDVLGRVAGIARSAPTRMHLVGAAILYGVVGWTLDRLNGMHLPHDQTFNAVLYLMWSGSLSTLHHVTPLFRFGTWVSIAAVATLLAAAALPFFPRYRLVRAAARRFYRYALALPLFTILALNLGRFVANGVYAMAGVVDWDLTPMLARIEAPVIELLQRALGSAVLSSVAAHLYSVVWLIPIVLIGFVLLVLDRPKAMNELIVAFALTALLAVPFFVLMPTFDPWSTNALYGATGTTTEIAYLYPNVSIPRLTLVNTRFHWAAGSALPSLHVGYPLVIALLLRHHGLRTLSAIMMGMAAITGFAVIYLGRHWILDVVAAVPFAIGVYWLARRLAVRLTLGPDGAASTLADAPIPAGIYRPAAALRPAAIDADAAAARWLAMVFFISGFAALLYQIVWQRTLFSIIGLNIEAVTLVVTVFMLGLGTGSLVGGALSKRPDAPLALLFAVAEVGIGIFGLCSLALFHHLGRATLTMTPFWTAVSTFAMLLPPTILMGATLPLLVANQVRTQRNVGDAVGWLYFTNTLGSAAAAILAALLLLGRLGQSGTVQVAAMLNIGVGVMVYLRTRRAARTG